MVSTAAARYVAVIFIQCVFYLQNSNEITQFVNISGTTPYELEFGNIAVMQV